MLNYRTLFGTHGFSQTKKLLSASMQFFMTTLEAQEVRVSRARIVISFINRPFFNLFKFINPAEMFNFSLFPVGLTFKHMSS